MKCVHLLYIYCINTHYMYKKFLLLFLLTACVANTTFAQDCGGVDEKKDSFTGKTIKSSRTVIGNLMMKWIVNMDQSDGATYMKWSIAMQGEYNQQLAVGTVLMLKLEDGKVLSLKTIEPTTPVTQALNGGSGTINVFSTYNLRFQLSKEELTALSKSSIEDLKIDVPGLSIKNPKIKGRQMGKIQDAAGCLLATF